MSDIQYLYEPKLTIDGKEAPQDLLEDILQISVEESLHLPSVFKLVIKNDYLTAREDDEPWQHEKLFQFGNKVKIGFRITKMSGQQLAETSEGEVLEGEITGMEAHFTARSQAPVVIWGYDISHRLHRGRYNRSFQNMTDSDIVSKVIQEIGISKGTIDSTGSPHDYVFQENQTNMEFLRERAARHGFELYVQNGKLNFHKPKSQESLDLTWLDNLQSFRVRVSSAEQVKQVEVRGWDYEGKKAIVSTKNSEKILTATDYGSGQSTKIKPADSTMVVVDQPVFSPTEADKIAQALLDELGGDFVVADGLSEGNPKLRPGRIINLKKMGKYSGKYYVTETRHLFQERIYSTEITVRGLRGGDLLSILSPVTRLQPGQTHLVGRVTNNNDPKNLGRVRVKFPTLTEEHESNWARVVAVGAGQNRGLDCLPEKDDEVLVAFEHGDIHRPYVIGAVWNGKDEPPEKVKESVVDGKVRLRTFKTRTGHSVQFIDDDKGGSKKGIHLKTVDGHEIYVNDSDKKIEIKTNKGQEIVMNDNGNKIDISAGNEINLKAKNIALTAQQKITLTAKQSINMKGGMTSKIDMTSSEISVEGVQAKLTGKAKTAVKGGIVQIN